jgi:hypothetical protein
MPREINWLDAVVGWYTAAYVIRMLQEALDAAMELAHDQEDTGNRLGWLLLHAMGERRRLRLTSAKAERIGPHAIHLGRDRGNALTVDVWPVDESAPECQQCGRRHQVWTPRAGGAA